MAARGMFLLLCIFVARSACSVCLGHLLQTQGPSNAHDVFMVQGPSTPQEMVFPTGPHRAAVQEQGCRHLTETGSCFSPRTVATGSGIWERLMTVCRLAPSEILHCPSVEGLEQS